MTRTDGEDEPCQDRPRSLVAQLRVDLEVLAARKPPFGSRCGQEREGERGEYD